MADAIVQIAPDSTGKDVDCSSLTVGSNTVYRQRLNIADPTTAAGLAPVLNTNPVGTEYGLYTRIVQAASGAHVALSSPPSATNAGSATALVWTADINHIEIQNNSTGSVGVNWRGAAATAGSFQVPMGAVVFKDMHIAAATGISLFTAAATNINGSTAGNIVVGGES